MQYYWILFGNNIIEYDLKTTTNKQHESLILEDVLFFLGNPHVHVGVFHKKPTCTWGFPRKIHVQPAGPELARKTPRDVGVS